jgi:hypothetical protein
VGLGFIASVIGCEWLAGSGGWVVIVAGLTGFGLLWLGASLDDADVLPTGSSPRHRKRREERIDGFVVSVLPL